MSNTKPRRGRGEGTILQRPNGTWYAQYSSPDGRKTVSGATKGEVQKRLRKAQSTVDEKKPIKVNSNMTVDGLFSFWLSTVVAVTKSAATLRMYTRCNRLWITPILGPSTLDSLCMEDVEAVMQNMVDKKAGASYRQSVRSMLKLAFEFAINRKLMTENFASAIPIPSREHTEFTALTADQVKAFFAAVKPERLACVWQTAFQTGMRIGELLALQRTDVDLVAGLIHVRRTQTIVGNGEIETKAPKTKAGRRSITIGKALRKQIADHIRRMDKEGHADSPWLFCDESGEILTRRGDVLSSFWRTLKRAGLPRIRIHDTRHTHATLLLQSGINAKVISERLGHADVVITLKIYSHVQPNMQADAANRLDDLLK